MNGLNNILQSRKALLTLLSVLCLTVLVAMGKVSAEQFMNFIMVTLPTYLGAQGLEDAAAKYNPLPPSANPPSNEHKGGLHAVSVPGTTPHMDPPSNPRYTLIA